MRAAPIRAALLGAALLGSLGSVAAARESPQGELALLEAVELTLRNDPAIALVEARRDASRGSLLLARGAFDPRLTSELTGAQDRRAEGAAGSRRTETLSTSVGLSRQLRGGLSLEPSLRLDRTEVDGSGALTQASVAFTLRQPLLRDRGREVVAAGELAAERELAAAELDLRHTVSQRLLSVIEAYWSFKAAAESFQVLAASEASSRELLATTRQLIEADLTPAAELVQLEADVTAKESSRIGGERDLFAARQSLGREIGLPPDEIPSLPPPSDPFPRADSVPSPEGVPAGVPAAAMEGTALAHRADLAAARERATAARIREKATANALLPSLDLVATPSYAGEAGGDGPGDFLSPLWTNVPGLSASLSLRLAWPVGNRQAEGNLLVAQANRRQRELEIELLRRQIGADVPAALDAVVQGARLLERATAAVSLFERVVNNEDRKLQAGRSTLLDVIAQRDRLTAARQREVGARQALAVALARLRFATGTLLTGDGDRFAVTAETLLSLPAFGPPRSEPP